MTKKQTMESANNAINERYGDDVTDLSVVNQRIGFRIGFLKGANWRINSVWHDRTENASMDNGEIVFVFPDGSAMTKSVLGWNWGDIQEHFKFVKWAYMKDLLPMEE